MSEENIVKEDNVASTSKEEGEALKLILRVVKSSFFMPQTEWVLEPKEHILGRYPSNDIVIPDPYVSRRHARLFFKDGKWFIEDLDSTNGTIVNNEDIRDKGPVALVDNAEIIIGLTVLTVKLHKS